MFGSLTEQRDEATRRAEEAEGVILGMFPLDAPSLTQEQTESLLVPAKRLSDAADKIRARRESDPPGAQEEQ